MASVTNVITNFLHMSIHILNKMTREIYEYLNSNKFTLAVFLDFRKAFDTVRFDIFLDKLGRHSVRVHALQPFKS